jgi:ubiquinone/menaquinone biosynthesis C-methylase UbiE
VTQGGQPYRFDFGPVATVYDQWYETAEGRRFDQLEKRVVQKWLAPARPGDTLLEVGSGTGWWSRFFGDFGYRVTGVDIAPGMIEMARENRIPKAQFEIADAQRLPFPDHSFAVVAAITAVEFTRDPQLAIREMVRCTRPGGQLILGILNAAAPINRQRQAQTEGPFANARFFTKAELFALLAPFGKTTVTPSAFPFSLQLPGAVAGLADDLQAILRVRTGAFLVAKVEL